MLSTVLPKLKVFFDKIEKPREECGRGSELPPPEGSGFLLPRLDYIPAQPECSFPSAETFLSSHVWKAGYGTGEKSWRGKGVIEGLKGWFSL
jgi:hypothetical protein